MRRVVVAADNKILALADRTGGEFQERVVVAHLVVETVRGGTAVWEVNVGEDEITEVDDA